MKKEEFEYYQVLFDTISFYIKYQIDLSLVDLIRNVIHPYFSNKPLFLDGNKVDRRNIKRCLIVKTDYSIQRKIKFSTHDSIDEWMEETNIFKKLKDYTPYFFQNYENTPTQEAITKLLQQELQLKKEQTNLIVIGADEETIRAYDDKISRIGGQIAYVAGAFLRGYLEHGQ